jgi:hypothetical protein
VTRRRLATCAIAAFVVAASVWALVQAVAAPAGDERAEVAGVPAAVAVTVDQGDVAVRAEPGRTAVEADADVRAVVAPDREAAMAGDEARLSWRCRFWTTCRADVDARVPAGVHVTAETAFGDVTVTGPVGHVDLETGSGGVRAEGIRGRAAVAARSGDVDLRFAAVTDDVEVETSSGDVTIHVPAGAYRIEADTGAGEVTLRGVRHDDAASARIVVDTTAGDVLISASAGRPGRGGRAAGSR